MRALLALSFVLWGCAPTSSEAPNPAQPEPEAFASCEAAVEFMSACYPELREARCTEETLAQMESSGLLEQGCEAAESMGKADLFAMGGCGEGEHVCGWLFCCDDFTLNWAPEGEADWEILAPIAAFQAEIPEDIRAAREGLSVMDLWGGASDHWIQEVVEEVDGEVKEMAVEWTQGWIPIDFETFTARLAPQDWGVSLAHYLGGEVDVYTRDALGRATRQVERMALSPLPCDFEVPLLNNDMTKVEIITYTEVSARIDWRVMFSDNGSTEADVGSLTFEAYEDGTLVTFHSAHRLAVAGLHVPNGLILSALSDMFLNHLPRYEALVSK